MNLNDIHWKKTFENLIYQNNLDLILHVEQERFWSSLLFLGRPRAQRGLLVLEILIEYKKLQLNTKKIELNTENPAIITKYALT